MCALPCKPEWIVFGAKAAPESVPAVAALADKQKEVGASIIHFDEASGIAMNE